jgi:polyisoprenoid-binding protein YceI
MTKTAIAIGAAALATTGIADAVQAQMARDVAPAAPATWNIDVVHSELSFRVRHLTGRVRGNFTEWAGSIVTDPASLTQGSATVEVKTASINTENADRDKHLRSADFFDVEKYPTLTFKSTRVELKGTDLTLYGDLTIKGVTKPVVLKGTYSGTANDPWGNQRIAFEAGTTVNRKEFGLTWGKMVEGVALVGDEIAIDLAVEAIKQK